LIYVSDNEKADNLIGYSTAKKLKLVKVSNSVTMSNEYSFIKEKVRGARKNEKLLIETEH
jgi:hypothetical protein